MSSRATTRWTTRQGRSIRYRVDGHGEPVVLLADPARDPAAWRTTGYTASLAPHCQLIDIDRFDDLEADIDTATAVLDAELVPQAHLCAYGSSARIAYSIAAARPERVASLIIGGFGFGTDDQPFGLGAVRSPALLYVGSRDPVVDHARRDAKKLGSPLAILAGLDHDTAHDAVSVVAPLVLSHLLAVGDTSQSRASEDPGVAARR